MYLVQVKDLVQSNDTNTVKEIECVHASHASDLAKELRKLYHKANGYGVQVVYSNPVTHAHYIKQSA